MKYILQKFETYAKNEFSSMNYSKKLNESMMYSFFSSGKRLRPLLMFCFAKLFNRNCDINLFFPPALALEMVHTYSLIHDDLPCMDDSRFRRNKPSNHLIYGEDIALLSGDALLTESFRYVNNMDIDYNARKIIIDEFINANGLKGMISGQSYDIQIDRTHKEILTLKQLQHIHFLKTGKLFEFSLIVPLVINKKVEKKFLDICRDIGVIFQAIDDYKDANEINTGKEKGIDYRNNKLTYLNFMSKYQLKKYIKDLQKNLLNKVDNIDNSYNKEYIYYFLKKIFLAC